MDRSMKSHVEVEFNVDGNEEDSGGRMRRKRVGKPCLRCRESKVKCPTQRPCPRCVRLDCECVEPVRKKRGPKPKHDHATAQPPAPIITPIPTWPTQPLLPPQLPLSLPPIVQRSVSALHDHTFLSSITDEQTAWADEVKELLQLVKLMTTMSSDEQSLPMDVPSFKRAYAVSVETLTQIVMQTQPDRVALHRIRFLRLMAMQTIVRQYVMHEQSMDEPAIPPPDSDMGRIAAKIHSMNLTPPDLEELGIDIDTLPYGLAYLNDEIQNGHTVPTYVQVNRAAADLFGYTVPELRTMIACQRIAWWMNMCVFADWLRALPLYLRILHAPADKPFAIKYACRVRRRDGQIIPMVVVCQAKFHPDGRPRCFTNMYIPQSMLPDTDANTAAVLT
eukprot:TRINITY_DN664_c0_g2_i1.p1 TRINITY_DN664_c0_g2~~TRINITY_DN664_c0_g2_i1.p1  ORF type:complete len:390 (-),score=57.43 TRINITY_DN664_c0_g2_i1:806-1975(-)